MPILNRAAELQDEVCEWRRSLHRAPELLFAVEKTAGFIAEKLNDFGVDEVVTGIGRTGLVGVIRGKEPGRTIGLRADMDALPIHEESGKAWASEVPGKMHACGHDGHSAMLLGAARYLAENRNFAGTVVVIFQPAEEGGGGGNEMVRDGLMERFSIDEVYGMHNLPGLAVGQFAMRTGPIMASTDEFSIIITGKGGHAAMPHLTVDPILIGAQVISGLQTIASRNTDPLKSVVVSVTQFHGGHAHNVIPDKVKLNGTVRTLVPEMRDLAEMRLKQIVQGIAQAQGGDARIVYSRSYPVTVNHPNETQHAAAAALDIVGAGNVETDTPPMMGGEDFSYMLEARPGAFVFIGNGDTAGLHHPEYDFNDEIIPYGISYWVRLVESRLAA